MEERNGDAIYIIEDLSMFVDSVRKIVYSAFGSDVSKDEDSIFEELTDLDESDIEEMESVLSKAECMTISKSHIQFQKNKKTKKQRIVMTNNNFNAFIEAVNARLVSNLLASLVKKGLIESAYDPEEDDFIFWTPNTKKIDEDDEEDT
jgi:hypothetical protein